MPRLVTAFSNETVKRLRSLRDKKARRVEGLFLAEGLRIIAEARDSGRLPEIVMSSRSKAAPKPSAGRIGAVRAQFAASSSGEARRGEPTAARAREAVPMLLREPQSPLTPLRQINRALGQRDKCRP